jgi:apolipoprotein D and lipocalin family protein
MKFTLVLSACLALFAPAGMALAGQLQPAQPVPVNLYSGRWYEIARTPNHMQGDCQASTTDFSGWASGAFQAVQTCHQGAPNGPAKIVTVNGRVLPATQNAKMQLEMLGGLLTQQYWILDHAADDGWLIMAIPNDRYVWLMARQPALNAAARATALARLQQLGFDLTHLAFPQQPGR